MTDKYTRRLTPWFLFAEALGTFRRRWKRVIGVGVTVTIFSVSVGTLLDLMFGDVSEYLPTREKLMQTNIGFYFLWK